MEVINQKLAIEAQELRLQSELKALCALLGLQAEESEEVESEVRFAMLEAFCWLKETRGQEVGERTNSEVV